MNTTASLHVVLVPFMAPGHVIPAIEIAYLLAERGVLVTVVITPVNAARIAALIDRLRSSSDLPIRLVELPFPCAEAGLPDGCENFDLIPHWTYVDNFLEASIMFRSQVAPYLRSAEPRPSCIIFDMFNYWTADVARELRVPRLVFHGHSCFALLCYRMVQVHKIHERVAHLSEQFLVPGLPYDIMATMAEAPGFFDQPGMEKICEEAISAESTADGIVLNTFEELEGLSTESYKAAMDKNVWAIGPLCLSISSRCGISHNGMRGNQSSIDENKCRAWLDMKAPRSVLYVCFGSVTYTCPPQLMEIGRGLESAGRPFIWVIKACEITEELETWLEEFQERVKERGLVIKGWAPQAMILSHPAIVGFLTHCGWNSILEGLCAGLPMITWPHFADQFLNEKLLVEILKIGVAVGAKPVLNIEDMDKVMVPKEDIDKAIKSLLMDEGEEEEGRRERAKSLGAKARKAMQKGGSSHKDMTRLIDFISQNDDHNRINPV